MQRKEDFGYGHRRRRGKFWTQRRNINYNTSNGIESKETQVSDNKVLLNNKPSDNKLDKPKICFNAQKSEPGSDSSPSSSDVSSGSGFKRPTFHRKRQAPLKHVNQKQKNGSLSVQLNSESSFEQQVNDIISQVRITDQEIEDSKIVLDDVKAAFGSALPEVEPQFFGSVLSGTAFRTSDLDIYLHCPNQEPDPNFLKKYGHLPSQKNLFYRIHKIHAKVPIIRAINTGTGTKVDISFTSPYGVSNSRLVKHLCSNDDRVKKLLMIILLWARYHNLSNTLFSSFTIVLLVIFYLQIVNILPPLYKLIEKSNDNNWPTTFNEDISLLENTNEDSLQTLLFGFFTFYSEVHFNEVVISPFAGVLILSAFFESSQRLPEMFDDYKRLSVVQSVCLQTGVMTVQEPFALSLNTTKNIDIKKVEELKRACLSAGCIFRKVPPNDYFRILFSDFCTKNGSVFIWSMACPYGVNVYDWHITVTNAIRLVLCELLLMRVENYDPSTETGHKFVWFKYENVKNNLFTQLSAFTANNIFNAARSKCLQLVKNTKGSDFQHESKASRIVLEDIKKKPKINFKAIIATLSHTENGNAEVTFINDDPHSESAFNLVVGFLKGGNFKRFMSLAIMELTIRCQVKK